MRGHWFSCKNNNDLMTACHVVYDYEKKKFYKNIQVSNVDHKDEQKRYEAKVIKYDLIKDACILSSEYFKIPVC